MGALAQRKVLVLNKKWTAVGVVSLQRAIIMLFSFDHTSKGSKPGPKAEIIDEGCTPWTWEEWAMLRPEDGEEGIKACQGTFKIPEVIRLTKYDKMPQHKIHFSRRTIYKRDGNQCMYCGIKPGTEELTIDHVLPRSKGGLTTWENCVLACVACNSLKADKMMHEVRSKKYPNGMKLLTVPKKPHFDVYKGEIPYRSWGQWLNIAYWNCELQNDNTAK